MRQELHRHRLTGVAIAVGLLVGLFGGCQSLLKKISNQLTHWQMLEDRALDDPLAAVGGTGTLFVPAGVREAWPTDRLAQATPEELLAYYAPIFVQQRQANKQHPAYPTEYDEIGTAQLKRDGEKFKAFVAGAPCVYTLYQKRMIGPQEHAQLTYTAWYPAHPKMKLINVEAADIDSCVVRLTLDSSNAPLFYETIAACGCFHKVFVESWVEKGAEQAFGLPEKGKKFTVERTLDDEIDWEVAGIVDGPRDRPRRPVVFLKAGDHKVIGMGSAARLRLPEKGDVRPYRVANYTELYSVAVAGSTDRAPFFDMKKGGKVWGAERKESLLFGLFGVDNAGQPRANDQIKLHFDQSTWDDVTTYQRYLRLPPDTL